jgi:hypothetical protein
VIFELVTLSKVAAVVPNVTVEPVIEMEFEPEIVPVTPLSTDNALDNVVPLVPDEIAPLENSKVSNVFAPLKGAVPPPLLMTTPLVPVPEPSVTAVAKVVVPVLYTVNDTPLLIEIVEPLIVILLAVLAAPM